MQPKNGTLRTDTLYRNELKGPEHGGNVSDLEARINDGEQPRLRAFACLARSHQTLHLLYYSRTWEISAAYKLTAEVQHVASRGVGQLIDGMI